MQRPAEGIHPGRVVAHIFTPGLKPNMFPMASASGSDIVCVELEDGIAPRDKAKARKHALALYDTQQANDGVELIVRINSLREQFGIEDVAAILATDTPPPALILPKAAARFSLVYLPCVVRAAVSRARPSSVLGPVDICHRAGNSVHCSLYAASGRACLTGLGPAPLAGPIGAKAPLITRLKPTFCHLKIHRIYEVLLCHICSRIARCRLLGSWAVIRVATPNASSARATISAGCEVGDSWCKYPNETTCE